MTRIIVVCGSAIEFRNFVLERNFVYGDIALRPSHLTAHTMGGDIEWRFLRSPDQLRGLTNYEIEFYGSFQNRADFPEIMDLLNIAKTSGDLVTWKFPQRRINEPTPIPSSNTTSSKS